MGLVCGRRSPASDPDFDALDLFATGRALCAYPHFS